MTQVVELEILARPELVGVARMAVAALAGLRPGLSYERVDDLRIVVSEVCTSAIEALGEPTARMKLRCLDGSEQLEVVIEAPAGAFDPALAGGAAGDGERLRISLVQALVDEAEVRTFPGGSRLRLVLFRERAADGDDPPA